MINTSHPQNKPSPKLIKFLRQKYNLSENALNLGIRHSELEQTPLPIILWSFGIITLLQYKEVLEWQDSHS